MNSPIRTFLVSTVFAGALFANPCAATPTQGTLGATSSGIANISVTKSVQAQISDISDMTTSNWTLASGDITMSSNICVYSSTGGYTVTASGNGTANAFTLSNGGLPLVYTVSWNGGGAGSLGSSGTTLLTGVPSAFTHASTTDATCSGGGSSNDTARVFVNISSVAMQAAIASSTPYTGTLTMLITPN